MKTQKTKPSLLWVCIFFGLIWLVHTNCDNTGLNEIIEPDPISVSIDNEAELNHLINQIDLESDILLVSNMASIQDAIDASNTGATIYIQAGDYEEYLNFNNKNLSLIALCSENEKVIVENSEIKISPIQTKQLKHKRSFITMARKDLGNNIAHYTFDVTLGPEEFDLIRIHRVIHEERPYDPMRTKGNVFMIHGAIQDFDDIFLTAGADIINEETSAPYFLAINNIDVWGIDLAWTRVPFETSDFNFMKNWGVEKDINHTLKAMMIARIIRGFTGQGFSKMNLLGFSYGVDVIYGAANNETQIHPIRRDIKGLIPVDSQLKTNDQTIIDQKCADADKQMNLINDGMYHNPWGVGLIQLGTMALNAPNDASPVPDFAGLTNIQVMNAIGSSHAAGWHFFGGTPFEYYYTDPYRFVNLSVALSPHMPRQMFYEMAASGCPSKDVSYDDHLEEIKLPIFNISAEGGAGANSNYTAHLTQSSDINHLNIIDDTRETQFNFGHADLWMGYDANTLMWNQLQEWLIGHN